MSHLRRHMNRFVLLLLWIHLTTGSVSAFDRLINDKGLDQFIREYLIFKTEHKSAPWWTESQYAGHLDTLEKWRQRLMTFDIGDMSTDARIDHRLLQADLDTELIRFGRERRWRKDPTYYLPDMSVFDSPASLDAGDRSEILKNHFQNISQTVSAALGNLRKPRRFFRDAAQTSLSESMAVMSKWWRATASAVNKGRDLEQAYENALTSLARYRRFLEDLDETQLDTDLGIGAEIYSVYLKSSHLLEDDAASLLVRGEGFFEATKTLLEETAKEIDPGTSWQELIRENRRNHPTAEDLLSAWEREIARARAHVQKHGLVTIPLGERVLVVETPPSQRHKSPFGIMETPLPDSSAKIGRLIINPVAPDLAREMKEKLLSGHDHTFIRTIAPHETYPGHHLHALKIQENPRPLRRVFNSTLFTEGWGLYCEELMFETGYFPDGGRTRLTQLLSRLWRAARVILDVKLQTNQIGYVEARRFLEKEVMFEPQRSAGEVNMYLAEPTYFMTYIVGYFDIMKLREEYRQKMGPEFSLHDFHEALLQTGAIPVSLIRKRLLEAW